MRPDLGREELRLLPGGEVVALLDFVEVDEVGVGLLGPAPRGLIELLGGKTLTAAGTVAPLMSKNPSLFSQ